MEGVDASGVWCVLEEADALSALEVLRDCEASGVRGALFDADLADVRCRVLSIWSQTVARGGSAVCPLSCTLWAGWDVERVDRRVGASDGGGGGVGVGVGVRPTACLPMPPFDPRPLEKLAFPFFGIALRSQCCCSSTQHR